MLPRVVPPFAAALIAAQSSQVFDYVARQKIDGHAMRAAHWKQLPVPTPAMLEPHLPFIVPRVLELVYTSPDMSPLARDLDDRGEYPFAWDPDRRAALRAELDAFFFRLYGIEDRDDVEYIVGTLPTGADSLERSESQGDGGSGPRKSSWPPTTAWPKPTPLEPNTKRRSSRPLATDPGTGQTPASRPRGGAHRGWSPCSANSAALSGRRVPRPGP